MLELAKGTTVDLSALDKETTPDGDKISFSLVFFVFFFFVFFVFFSFLLFCFVMFLLSLFSLIEWRCSLSYQTELYLPEPSTKLTSSGQRVNVYPLISLYLSSSLFCVCHLHPSLFSLSPLPLMLTNYDSAIPTEIKPRDDNSYDVKFYPTKDGKYPLKKKEKEEEEKRRKGGEEERKRKEREMTKE